MVEFAYILFVVLGTIIVVLAFKLWKRICPSWMKERRAHRSPRPSMSKAAIAERAERLVLLREEAMVKKPVSLLTTALLGVSTLWLFPAWIVVGDILYTHFVRNKRSS